MIEKGIRMHERGNGVWEDNDRYTLSYSAALLYYSTMRPLQSIAPMLYVA